MAIDAGTLVTKTRVDLAGFNAGLQQMTRLAQQQGQRAGRAFSRGMNSQIGASSGLVSGFNQLQAGAAGFNQQLTDIERNTRRAGFGASLLARLRLLEEGFRLVQGGLQRYGQAVGELTRLEGRLRLVTDSTEQLVAVQDQLRGISNDTFTSLEATSDVYVRLANESEQLGFSQNEVLGITEALNQATLISGRTAAESENAVRQLTQAFGAGRLQGDEFRSVAENLPIVLAQLREATGLTTGELRELGAEGEVTAELLGAVLLDNLTELRREADKIPTTFGRAYQVLQNETQIATKNFDDQLGIQEDVAFSLATIADDVVPRVFDSLADLAAIIGGLSNEGIPSLISVAQSLATVLDNIVSAADRASGALSRVLALANRVAVIDRIGRAQQQAAGGPLDIARSLFGDEQARARQQRAGELAELGRRAFNPNVTLAELEAELTLIQSRDAEVGNELAAARENRLRLQENLAEAATAAAAETENRERLETEIRRIREAAAGGGDSGGRGGRGGRSAADREAARAAREAERQAAINAQIGQRVINQARLLEIELRIVQAQNAENDALTEQLQTEQAIEQIRQRTTALLENVTDLNVIAAAEANEQLQIEIENLQLQERLRDIEQERIELLREQRRIQGEFADSLRDTLGADTELTSAFNRRLAESEDQVNRLSDAAQGLGSSLVSALRRGEGALESFFNVLLDRAFNALGQLIDSGIANLIASFTGGGGGFGFANFGFNSNFINQFGRGGFDFSNFFPGGSPSAFPGATLGFGGSLGFRDGGSFRVGGRGPADSRLVQFMATPGEEVNIRRPGQSSTDSILITFRNESTGEQQTARGQRDSSGNLRVEFPRLVNLALTDRTSPANRTLRNAGVSI